MKHVQATAADIQQALAAHQANGTLPAQPDSKLERLARERELLAESEERRELAGIVHQHIHRRFWEQ